MRKWYGCTFETIAVRQSPRSPCRARSSREQQPRNSLGNLGRHTWFFHRGRFTSKQKATTGAVAFEQMVQQKRLTSFSHTAAIFFAGHATPRNVFSMLTQLVLKC